MKQLAQFIRSVIPADPAQLLFLLGVVCLVIAPRLKWWPVGMHPINQIGVLFIWPIIFASVAGYYTCFWPGTRPARRIFLLVVAPAFVGSALLFCLIFLQGHPTSVLERTDDWLYSLFWKAVGLRFSALGLLLISLFLQRVVWRSSSLPLSLSGVNAGVNGSRSWERVLFLIWFLIGLLFLCLSMVAFSCVLITSAIHGGTHLLQPSWLPRWSSILQTTIILGIVLVLVGNEERRQLLRAFRWPGEKCLVLAVFFPMIPALLAPLAQFVFALTQWAIYGAGGPAPALESYVDSPEVWLLLLLFPAFGEELIFRGLLQPKFIDRYGLYRGIVLVGITWAAFHFASDFSFGRANHEMVSVVLSFRIFMCIALSFVLAWLTLQSGSIFPAAIAHGLYNVFVFSNLGQPFPGSKFVTIFLWAVLAYLLFRYWPPILPDSGASDARPAVARFPAQEVEA